MTFLPECPHCGRQNMTFYYVADTIKDKAGNHVSFWKCGHCGGGVCGESGYSLTSNEIFDAYLFSRIYPEAKPLEAPQYTPENIAKSYKTAVKNLRNGGDDSDYEAAVLMARKALEAACNFFNAQGFNLKQKINYLAEHRVITPALAEWAHEIRDIGNEAAHESGPFTKVDAEQTVYFAEMLFTYLFTLPGMIAERRKHK
jgi:predicted metal-binding protein